MLSRLLALAAFVGQRNKFIDIYLWCSEANQQKRHSFLHTSSEVLAVPGCVHVCSCSRGLSGREEHANDQRESLPPASLIEATSKVEARRWILSTAVNVDQGK